MDPVAKALTPLARELAVRLWKGLLSWMGDRRGAASVEFALGAILIGTIAVVGLDLHRVVDARTVAVRAATTMAEYVSLETDPRAAHIDDLARFSYRHQIRLRSEAVFVVSAVSRDPAGTVPDPPTVVRWHRKTAVGEDPDAPPLALADRCGALTPSDGTEPAVLTELALDPGEMVVVAEVCLQLPPAAFVGGPLLAGHVYPTGFYAHQILPVRGSRLPREPL